MLALANVKKILFPAALLLYIFALIGLYSFSGKKVLIKVMSLIVAGLLIMSSKQKVGQSTRTKCFFAEREAAQSWTEFN